MLSKKMLILGVAATTSLTLAACAPAARPAPDQDVAPNQYRQAPNGTPMRQDDFSRVNNRYDNVRRPFTPAPDRTAYPDDGMQGFTNANPNLYYGRNRNNVNNFFQDADRIAKAAAQVNGVNNATAVIVGGTAYVGLDLNTRVNRRQADAVEDQVARHVSRVAPRYHVVVTSDADLFGQLREIDNGLRGGRPVDDYRNQLGVIDDRMAEARTHRAPVR
jgi:YhcN/YlaJ family sporulation lipoprotein